KRRLEVHAVEIVQPQLTVVQDPDGSLNLTKLFPASSTAPTEKPAAGGGLPFALRIDTLRIRDGQLTLDLPPLPGGPQVDGLQMQMSAQMEQQGLRAHIRQFVGRTSPAVIDLHTFQGALHMRDGVIQVEELRVQTGETLITAHGVLPGSAAPADFVLHMEPLALAEIGRVLANDLLREPLHLTLHAAGPPAALQVQGHLRTPAARVDLQAQLNTAAMPLQYEAQLGVTHVNLAALIGRAELQSDLNLQLSLQGAGVAPRELHSILQFEVQPSHLGTLLVRPSV